MKRLLWSIILLTLALVGGAYYWSGDARADAPQLKLATVHLSLIHI